MKKVQRAVNVKNLVANVHVKRMWLGVNVKGVKLDIMDFQTVNVSLKYFLWKWTFQSDWVKKIPLENTTKFNFWLAFFVSQKNIEVKRITHVKCFITKLFNQREKNIIILISWSSV